ncbi:hypothetical protein D3H35_08280 [Cohnella faecalis]|uniref:Uncharacterized protein n=1 Tax=Cohnella faecalis TaxID=2315694 RepID=A0A398CT60_9BACL|nr:hypothetical protein D3H35_08280 [Cohnella faecalis]
MNIKMTNEWRISLFAGIAERIGTRTLRERLAETRLLASDANLVWMTRFPDNSRSHKPLLLY